MAEPPVVVNYSSLADAFGDDAESVTDHMLGRYVDDLEKATVTATLVRAIGHLEDVELHREVMTAPDDRVAATFQSVVAEEAARLGEVSDPLPGGGREVQFDHWDARWAKSVVGLIRQRLNLGKFDFLPGPKAGDPLPDEGRVAVLGDWGSNAYGAPHVADSIRRDGAFLATLHLGDVYYSGSAAEIQGRFLAPWPFVTGAINRACNSNHEMYSGGKPYAKYTLPAFHQSSSMWWLENQHWVLLGLDTAYDDGQIGSMQAGWLNGICNRAVEQHKRVLLFSHHQPWTTDTGKHQTSLVRPLQSALQGRQVFGWYWGHEHLCSLFEQHPAWEMWGGCVGHAGFPYERPKVTDYTPVPEAATGKADGGTWYQVPERGETPAALLLDGPNRWVQGHEADYGPNGYAVLEFDGPHVQECVLTPSGVEIHRRQLA